MTTIVSTEDRTLDSQVVTAEYYIQRVRMFERKYDKTWWEFECEFKKDENAYLNDDFNEWAFLCRNFREQLIADEVVNDTQSPPGASTGRMPEKPDHESGFLLEVPCSIRILTTKMSKLR